MKVLSMIQPWASLFIHGEAQYETRTWKTSYQGPLAIHTSKKVDKDVCSYEVIQHLISKLGYTTDTLPTGVIIGVCQLENCLKVTEDNRSWAVLENGRIVSGKDYMLGDFDVGSYAWEVSDRKLLDKFIPAKGRLGLWEHDLSVW
ncbi:ASCH domain-containing protein [Bacillus sp. T33-2]|uniref:ASCH domain-containing protein n=1 Tax=Bacillus sp. T33-2 TaxID=2054168 RepID=UPI000C759F8F|nr:ASCH domain-containing protein [Bacillus sp. T33-2]PLR91993.1 2-oxoglutarate dehydrogenase E1 [Bacillus sp. T33-2]